MAVSMPVFGHQHGSTGPLAGARCAQCLPPTLAGSHGSLALVIGDLLASYRRSGRHLATGKEQTHGHFGSWPGFSGDGGKGGSQQPAV
jgi:hypothetical protein